ncbi:MAG: hypothetical protein HC819_14005 [Cyclobacteriaceae bacterium]|nr:hypothetical protein [Cyclobacteriaceae bacterium]
MSTFFYRLYLFNTRHKGLFFGGLITLLLFLAYQVSHISLDENISDIFPKDKEVSEIEVVFNSANLNSNLIVHIYATDSTLPLADSIIALSHQLDSALYHQFPDIIAQRLLFYPDSLVNLFFGFFKEHLPLYLSEGDYEQIGKSLTLEGVEATVEKNFKALMSPVGLVGSKMILRDPFGFVQLPLKSFQQSQFDPNFALYKNHLFTADRQHLLFFCN